ncbi:MAG: hypothetical protein QGH82_02880, partial [Candidatus Woesearchaeota archaeon]|nr:hypothetical protein [Candidatus Woesearchaeota archaeon]
DVEIKETPTAVTSEDDKTIDVGEKEVVVEEAASETEVEDYGKKVQSRIDKLTKNLREAQRREAAAIQYAQGVQHQAKELRSRVGNLDRGYVLEYGNRVKAETEDAKKKLKEAMDAGDIDAQVAANQDLARLAIETERHKATEAKRARPQAAEGGQQVQQPRPQYAPPPRQAPPPPDPKAEDWAEKNEWFGKDEPMTLTSFSIHRKLVEKGLDPSSDEYYSEIDKQMRDNFPHKFNQSSTPTQTVASVNRGGPVRRKGTVRLTPSQVAISKKLGVPLSEYAKYVKE